MYVLFNILGFFTKDLYSSFLKMAVKCINYGPM